jgi:hypothetical protein
MAKAARERLARLLAGQGSPALPVDPRHQHAAGRALPPQGDQPPARPAPHTQPVAHQRDPPDGTRHRADQPGRRPGVGGRRTARYVGRGPTGSAAASGRSSRAPRSVAGALRFRRSGPRPPLGWLIRVGVALPARKPVPVLVPGSGGSLLGGPARFGCRSARRSGPDGLPADRRCPRRVGGEP